MLSLKNFRSMLFFSAIIFLAFSVISIANNPRSANYEPALACATIAALMGVLTLLISPSPSGKLPDKKPTIGKPNGTGETVGEWLNRKRGESERGGCVTDRYVLINLKSPFLCSDGRLYSSVFGRFCGVVQGAWFIGIRKTAQGRVEISQDEIKSVQWTNDNALEQSPFTQDVYFAGDLPGSDSVEPETKTPEEFRVYEAYKPNCVFVGKVLESTSKDICFNFEGLTIPEIVSELVRYFNPDSQVLLRTREFGFMPLLAWNQSKKRRELFSDDRQGASEGDCKPTSEILKEHFSTHPDPNAETKEKD